MKSKTNNKEGERGRRKEQNIQTSQKTKRKNRERIKTVFRLDKMKLQIYLCTFLIYNIKISSFKMLISPRKGKETNTCVDRSLSIDILKYRYIFMGYQRFK